MLRRRHLLLSSVLALGISPLVAQSPAAGTTLTISIAGTLGPILQGSDPLNLNGQAGSLSLTVNEAQTPVAQNGSTVTYRLAPGNVTLLVGRTPFTTTTQSKLRIQLESTADILELEYLGQKGTIDKLTAYLAPGSWTTAILMHPTVFSPSPQPVTAATTAGGPGTQLKYADSGIVTVLGLGGAISNSSGN